MLGRSMIGLSGRPRFAPPTGFAAVAALLFAACGASHPKEAVVAAPVVVAPPIDPEIARAAEDAKPGENPATQIACGDFHTCALRTDGTVWCWGRNRSGQVNVGTEVNRPKAAVVASLDEGRSVALGSTFSCALRKDGTLRCWGSGKLLGDSVTREHIGPSVVSGLTDVEEVQAGGYVACARLRTGKVKCWGIDTPPKWKTPDVSKAKQIVAAAAHGCARFEDGAVRCWGENPWGGNGPFSKPAITGAREIATGDAFACAIVEQGKVKCWGRNDHGELGVTADHDYHQKPIDVPGVVGAKSIAAGESQACAVLEDGTAWCWGSNTKGELGTSDAPSTSEAPAPVRGVKDVVQISLGSQHTCARTKVGNIFCWGANGAGQLGDGTEADRLKPVRVRW
jgi:alpha-tubulin suppressor-like RCC1 family protein